MKIALHAACRLQIVGLELYVWNVKDDWWKGGRTNNHCIAAGIPML